MPSTRKRPDLRRGVGEAWRLDRAAFAARFVAAVDWDRTTFRAVSMTTGVPLRQITSIANARATLDWPYHAALVYVTSVEERMKRHFQSLEQRRMTRFEREAAARIGDTAGLKPVRAT